MSNFGLPVYYKKLGVALRAHVLTPASVAKWVVGALCEEVLEHLAVLMAAVSSYYHPTSQGAYSDQLVQFLTQLVHFFMLRLRLERYAAFCSVVNPDRVRSASFCWIRIGIDVQGMPVRIRMIRIGVNSKQM
jgi:hypothetical protein